ARYARNVELICDGVFRRHLEVRHVYSLHGDDTFILSFADLPEAEATRRAAVIANELMHRLVGNRFIGAQIQVGTIDRDAVITEAGELDLAAIEAAVAAARPVPVDDGDAARRAAGPDAMDDDWQAVPKGSPTAPDLRSAPPGKRQEQGEPRWQKLHWPPDGPRGAALMDALPDAAREGLPDGVTLVFRPTFAARWGRVTHYQCLPRRRHDDGRVTLGGAVLGAGVPAARRAALDLAVVYGALTELQAAVEARRSAEVILPVAFATLHAPYFPVLVDILHGFSDALRLRYLTLELVHVPPAATAAHLVGAVRSLTTDCRDLLVRVDPAAGDLRRFHGLPVRALGTVLPAAAHEARQIAESVLAALGGDHTYWWNVQTDDERRALIGAGGILINGPSIGADCPELMGEQELA
ncbi:MAG: hypothetical protein KDA49_11645, partial [Rhodospirillaceae bacterium]|nr:hypothetical protein [Rhodospirillaceae bacterium]